MSKPTGKKETQVESTAKCACEGCKTDAAKFSFCATHYEHYKFGLIKKDGKPVSDYDRKYEHYTRYFTEKGARKAA